MTNFALRHVRFPATQNHWENVNKKNEPVINGDRAMRIVLQIQGARTVTSRSNWEKISEIVRREIRRSGRLRQKNICTTSQRRKRRRRKRIRRGKLHSSRKPSQGKQPGRWCRSHMFLRRRPRSAQLQKSDFTPVDRDRSRSAHSEAQVQNQLPRS